MLLGLELRTCGLVFPHRRGGIGKLGYDSAGCPALKTIEAVYETVQALSAAITFNHPRRIVADDHGTRRACGISEHAFCSGFGEMIYSFAPRRKR
jgi:hypothetical protein